MNSFVPPGTNLFLEIASIVRETSSFASEMNVSGDVHARAPYSNAHSKTSSEESLEKTTRAPCMELSSPLSKPHDIPCKIATEGRRAALLAAGDCGEGSPFVSALPTGITFRRVLKPALTIEVFKERELFDETDGNCN